MLFRKTESPRVYLQQIGRVLRSHGKDNPLIFDCVLNYQNVKINLTEESQKEVNKYQKSLDDFGFTEIEIPKSITIKDEVREISKIIEEVEAKLNFYRSYENAKEAAQKLGIKSEAEYGKRRKEDVRLPSTPARYYKNKGWTKWEEFIIICYLTYEDAKESVQKLGIKTRTDYLKYKRYKEDTLLPSNPEKRYKNKGWVDWYHFLGTKAPSIIQLIKKQKKLLTD